MPAQRTVTTVTKPASLLPFLLEHWSYAKRTRVKQWLKFGSVLVNGAPVTRHDHALQPGDTVSIRTGHAPAATAADSSPPGSALPEGLKILHEDDAIIVLRKGAGWLTVARDSGKGRTAYAALTDHVRAADPRARVWIVHRLDRETSGLLLFAKTEPVKRALQRDWHRFEKKYLAVVEGVVKRDAGTLRCHLDESSPLRVRRVPPSADTREAITHFTVLARGAERSLVELRLETGRRHQIRVQLAGMGHPVVGDERYGAETNPADRLGLHASRLSFIHPASGETMTFESPLPPALAKLVP